jgi:hypothetical protein
MSGRMLSSCQPGPASVTRVRSAWPHLWRLEEAVVWIGMTSLAYFIRPETCILHRLREGCTWWAVPEVYDPHTTVFNRYNRWSKRGLWQGICAALADADDPLSRCCLE